MSFCQRTLVTGVHVCKQLRKSCQTKLTGRLFSTNRLPTNILQNTRVLAPCDRCHRTNGQLEAVKYNPVTFLTHQRSISTSFFLQSSEKPKEDQGTDTSEPKELSIYQRFKKAYKEHGKVLVGVHVLTSTVWISSFYYLVVSGVDIVPIIESWEIFSAEKIANLKSSHAKDFVQAYLMYKLATPARYTVTLLGTNFTIKYFQKTGRIPKAGDGERLRDIVKDGRQELKAKRKEIDTRIKTKTSNLRSRRKGTTSGDQKDST